MTGLQRRLSAALAGAVAFSAAAAAQASVNIYSARHYDTDDKLYSAFEERTGITVNVLEASSDQLVERIKREGRNTPADILLTVDAGRIWRAVEAGVLGSTDSNVLKKRLPDAMRAPKGRWFGFSKRMRLIFYNKANFDPSRVKTYEDLAKPGLKNTLCIRSSNNIYNQSLVASLIHYHGPGFTQSWIEGLVQNMARRPQGGDIAQLQAAAADGECQLAVANHYYYLRLATHEDAEIRETANKLGVIFPNSKGRGVHVNVSAAGRVKHSPHPEAAKRFLEYLSSAKAQKLFAQGNQEYPVVEGVKKPKALQRWGDINQDDLNVSILGKNNAQAVKLMDKAGWR